MWGSPAHQPGGLPHRPYIPGPRVPGGTGGNRAERLALLHFHHGGGRALQFPGAAVRKDAAHPPFRGYGNGPRQFLPDQLEELLSRLGELDSLHPEGLGAHLPCADEDREITLRQIALFERMAARIREKLPLKYCHLANSAASLDYEIPSNNMCRPGLVLYGFSPLTPHGPLN